MASPPVGAASGSNAAAPAAPNDPRPGPPPIVPPLPVGRRQVALLVGALVVLWIVVVVARAVSASAAARDRTDALRVENASLAAQYAARQRELLTVQSGAFVRLEARAYGMGAPGERTFALRPGSPSPQPIRLLGSETTSTPPGAPIDAWMTLLFGP
jgi:hypothetical protein